MNSNDRIELSGRVKLILCDAQGRTKETREMDNLVVLAGRTFIASRMAGTAAAVMSHMAVGTGAVAAAAGDTTLGAEVAASRTALGSTTPSSNTIVYACSFGAGVGTGALTEAGVFNAASSGTLLARIVFAVVNKAAGDSMTVNWTITLS